MTDPHRPDPENPSPPEHPPEPGQPPQPESKSAADPPRPAPRRHGPPGWVWALPVLLLVAGGLAGGAWYLAAQEPEVETHLVLQGNIDVRQVNLAFKVGGRVETLAVDEGDAVRGGDVVATLEKRYFYDDLHLAQARVASAAAELEKLENGSRPQEVKEAKALVAQREAQLAVQQKIVPRLERLLTQGGVPREDVDRERAALETAQAQLDQARESLALVVEGPRREDIAAARAKLGEQRAALSESERRLEDSHLVAPNDGVILTRAREVGAIVQPGETIFTLTLTSPVWVRTYVNERDLGLVRPGTEAVVLTDSDPGHPYTGHVGFISPAAEFTPKNVETRELRTDLVYRLRVVVDNPDGGLRQGMPVTVKIALPEPRPLSFWERLRGAVPFLPGGGAE